MSVKIDRSEYVNVAERAKELGCEVPGGIALLPRNFETAHSRAELVHESDAPTIRILFRENEVEETPIEPAGERFPYVSEKSLEWIGPTIFIGYSLYTQNPNILNITLGIIANYLTDFFRGIRGGATARFSIVRERSSGECERYDYEGPPSAIEDFAKVVREIKAGD
jgi:hypothetical protein